MRVMLSSRDHFFLAVDVALRLLPLALLLPSVGGVVGSSRLSMHCLKSAYPGIMRVWSVLPEESVPVDNCVKFKPVGACVRSISAVGVTVRVVPMVVGCV